jgi:hypothetical protein
MRAKLEQYTAALKNQLSTAVAVAEALKASESALQLKLAESVKEREKHATLSTQWSESLSDEREKVSVLEQQLVEAETRADKAVRRLMTLHTAFEKGVADNVKLREQTEELKHAKVERERTIGNSRLE